LPAVRRCYIHNCPERGNDRDRAQPPPKSGTPGGGDTDPLAELYWGNIGAALGQGGGGGSKNAANNGQPPDPSKKNSPACKQAKAQLSSIGHQLSALDSSLRHDYFKNQLAAAGVGCVSGMIGGEAIESPLIGTPAAPGNCAVGAVTGVSWNNIQYVLTNASALGTEFSLMGQAAKAAANVISACY
jgi:hypothetical protein